MTQVEGEDLFGTYINLRDYGMPIGLMRRLSILEPRW